MRETEAIRGMRSRLTALSRKSSLARLEIGRMRATIKKLQGADASGPIAGSTQFIDRSDEIRGH